MEILKKIQLANWEHPDGFALGIDQIVLANTLDESSKCGIRTRLVRFKKGTMTEVPFIHDYHEEVLLLEGDQILLDADNLSSIEHHHAKTYFKRPAGTLHGPFRSDNGCLLFEIHYY
jgi:hypothetical protein